ncbi:uncharacterized protein LOC128547468 [Mercenaria mercenaria]|uniref:uncharacterized protein LOC128547468 n=1 Tax=Mercenaria mercenaria TaxID=6596 RepID=UPI00234F80A7|nr:uncharacterized protein LOC128547468 [Mercenaria mercenaria]
MADVKEQLSLKKMSIVMSLILDILGFSRECIQERIDAMNSISLALTIATRRILGRNDVERILTGSIREGVGLCFLNDRDYLQIDHSVVCGTDRLKLVDRGKLAFKMEQRDTPGGYCFLKLLEETVSPCNGFLRLQHALVQQREERFLSSSIFITSVDEMSLGKGSFYYNDRLRTRHGPSLRKQNDKGSFTNALFIWSDLTYLGNESDFVRAFPCKGESFLQKWKNRDRPSGWPYKKTIAHVMCLQACVVPVGHKGTKYEDLQWRICFTEAEIHLVQALNGTQKKIYVLLKLIAKHIIRPLSADITSYVMKMVILWLAEKIPQKKFRRKHLLVRLKDAVIYLRQSVRNKNLPNYMTPSRNMFAGKLQGDEQINIINKLDSLLEHGQGSIEEFLYVHILHNKDVQEYCCSIFFASLFSRVSSCNFALYTTNQLASIIVSDLKCGTYWHKMLISIPQFLQFIIVYGNRPFDLTFAFVSRLAFVKKRESHAWRHDDIISHKNLNQNNDVRNHDLQNVSAKWIVPVNVLLTLIMLIMKLLQNVQVEDKHSMHIFIFVIYLWFLDDKARENICKILIYIHLALVFITVFEHMSVHGFVLINHEDKRGYIVPRTLKSFFQLSFDIYILTLNTDTLYF